MNHITVGFIVFGGILLLGATMWSHWIDPRNYWTEEDAQARAEWGEKGHMLAHHAEHVHTDQQKKSIQAEREEIQTHLDQAEQNFQNAKNRYEWPSRLMRYSGMACLVLGILGYYVTRSADG